MRVTTRAWFFVVLVTLFATVLASCAPVATQAPSGSSAGTSSQATTPPVTAPTTAPTTAPAAATAPSGGGAASATTTTGGAGASATTTTGAAAATAPAAATSAAPGAQATSAAPAIQLPASCSSVTIQYWNPFTGPDGPFMTKLVNDFQAANSKVQVKVTTLPDYVTKMTTAAASDTEPDVASINEDQVATMAFNHVLRPIPDNLLTQLGVSAKDFPKAAWDIGGVAGKQYAIPLSIVELAMYYNMDLLQKAGITAPPQNAADFDKAATAMTQGSNHGFVITTGFPNQQIFQQILHQYGGTEFNQDASKATWDSDAGVKALQWMVDAQKKYSAPKLPVDADLNAFKAGQAGMIWNGIWQLPNVTGSAVSFKSGATATPQIGDQPAAWAGASLFALPVHKAAADPCKDTASIMLIRYVLDHSAQWAGAGNIPALTSVRHSAQFQSMQPYASIAPEVENPVFLPAGVPGVADAFAPLGSAVGAVLSGNTTDIKGALTNAANQANQILAQNKQKYGNAP